MTSYQCLGLYEKAEELIDQNLGEDPQPERGTIPLWPQRVNLALAQKKFDIAHDLLDLLIADSPDNPSYPSQKGFVYFLQDDLPNAEKMYQRLVANERPRIQISAFEYLAAVSLSRGRVEEAKQRIRRAIELTKGLEDYGPDMERPYRSLLAYLERLSGRLPEALREAELSCEGVTGGPYLVKTLYLKALITIEMNRFEEFEKQAKEIKRYLEYLGPDRVFTGAPRFMRVYDNLLGHRELQKKNYDLAIQYFWKALDLLSPLAAESIDADHAKYYFDLAEAYRRAGSLPDAVRDVRKGRFADRQPGILGRPLCQELLLDGRERRTMDAQYDRPGPGRGETPGSRRALPEVPRALGGRRPDLSRGPGRPNAPGPARNPLGESLPSTAETTRNNNSQQYPLISVIAGASLDFPHEGLYFPHQRRRDRLGGGDEEPS